ncbi:hypothetical protein F5Y17DRAFT_448479 [Xylariaceae sp. FL0594]|nr:hypothetical protein F5Y17DRAFT_448479 [Xylariaceae sp. FL0594]
MCIYVRRARPKCHHLIDRRWFQDPANPNCVGRCPKPAGARTVGWVWGSNTESCVRDCTITED